MMTHLYARFLALSFGVRLAIGAMVFPWFLAYFALVLRWTGVVAFWVPAS